jgi:ATP-dependent DNA helicase RecQ
MNNQEISKHQILNSFKEIWGYDNFRQPQGEIIDILLQGKDALIIMPTGGGKSICFQLPALLQNGLTLVISPLIALMENQVQELQKKQLPAALLHSEIPKFQRQETLEAIIQQQLRLLYLSPETLLSKPIWGLISQPQIKINGLILDEAHCLAQWGETFRPSYLRLGAIRPTLLKYKPPQTKITIAAFTATADPETQDIITKSLRLQNPDKFLLNPYRANLNLQIKTIWTPKYRKETMLKFIKNHHNQCGLVYVRTRKNSELISSWLSSFGYKNYPYHAGLTAIQRRTIEQDWLSNKIQFVVCTCAFGMGVNKPDVRWICHYQTPIFLTEYIQEIGRGGRDGKPTDCLTLISEPTGLFYPEDQQMRQFFLQQSEKEYYQTLQILSKIPPYETLEKLEPKLPKSALYLGILNSANQLKWLDPFSYELSKNINPKAIKFLMNRQKKLAQQMKAYLAVKSCRWGYLLTAFGFNVGNKFKCGNCDNCLR